MFQKSKSELLGTNDANKIVLFLIYQCFAVRGSADVRVRGVLDSILLGMEITAGKDDTMEA